MIERQRYLPVLIILLLYLTSSCATTDGKINVKISSDMKAIDVFREEAGIKPIWSSWPDFDFNGDDVKNRMLSLIENAQDYILINSFLLMYDEYGSVILDALKEKYDSGVNVYVIADSSNFFVPGKSGFMFMQENNIPYAEYNPIRLYKLLAGKQVLYRDHRKFWIVDGKYLYIGGCNIINSSLTPEKEGGNVDGMVLVESEEAVRILIEAFVGTWNRFSAYRLDGKMFKTAPQQNSTGITLTEDGTGLCSLEADCAGWFMYSGALSVKRLRSQGRSAAKKGKKYG